MNNNNYYTPEIEEFHIGFEYEFLVPSGDWIKQVAGEKINKWEKTFEIDYYSVITDRTTKKRVKYLDEKDIEELGWKSNIIKINSVNEMEVYKIENIVITTPISLYEKTKKLDISWLAPLGKERLQRIFIGTIKNKSELKKLMIQLGII